MSLQQIIKKQSIQYMDEWQSIRHHLHAHPELGFQEEQTSKYIQQQLKKWGIPFSILAENAVVGIIQGKNPNKSLLALRADIDALPIQEENSVPYKSKNKNIMHACGHDVHTTCLLGALKLLDAHKKEWEGSVKFIFQPAEEVSPGGASILIKQGVLKNPQPDAIVGLHVDPFLPCGQLSFCEGKAMASCDELYITIIGDGGHAAMPHLTQDIILAASNLVVSLQSIISRRNKPLSPSVLSICAFNGGYTTNVIPKKVNLQGTFRAMDERWRAQGLKLIKEQVKAFEKLYGCKIQLEIRKGYPCLYNHEQLTKKIKLANEHVFGKKNVIEGEKRMGAEDFAWYSQIIPACFFRLGVRNEKKGIVHNIHTSRFDIDEKALPIGIQALVNIAINFHFFTF